MVQNIAAPQCKSRSHFAASLTMIALLSACASDASSSNDLGGPTLSEEDLQWGDVGDAKLEYIGEANLETAHRVSNLLKLARIPFRADIGGSQVHYMHFVVPESRADEARAYLEKYARGRGYGYRPQS